MEGEAQGLETTMTDDGLVFSTPDFRGDHIRFCVRVSPVIQIQTPDQISLSILCRISSERRSRGQETKEKPPLVSEVGTFILNSS